MKKYYTLFKLLREVHMIKSFLNYPGSKYKLLPQLIPIFNEVSYSNFVDMFTGSAVVSLNQSQSSSVMAIDNNSALISLMDYVQHISFDEMLHRVLSIIEHYNLTNSTDHGYAYYNANSTIGLSQTNKDAFINLRNDYNKRISQGIFDPIMLYTLVVFGFNNQIRFNNKKLFNNPVGKRDFNINMRKKLFDFIDKSQSIHIDFISKDFRDINPKITDSLYYADPPYLITNAVYNERGNWTNADELDLLNKLDTINMLHNKFALSNIIEVQDGKKEIKNEHLINWISSHNYRVVDIKSSYKNSNYQRRKKYTREVLITNF